MLKIKDLEIKNDLVIAPMAGITNNAFVDICFNMGAGMVIKEMVSDKAIIYNNEKTLKMIDEPEVKNGIIGIQLFGHETASMVAAAKILDQTNYDLIDINMGCPVNKVVRQGSGSALMLDPKHAVAMIAEIVKNVQKPVTVKMRLGYDKEHMNYLEIAKELEAVGVSAISLHARTRGQMYEGKSDWEHIKILKEQLSIPVIGNGDITCLQDYIDKKNYTKADGMMIARAAVGKPYLIKEIIDYQKGLKNEGIDLRSLIDLCLEHAKKLIALKGEDVGMREFRGIGTHYLSGLPNCTPYRGRLIKISTYNELEILLDEYYNFYQNKINIIKT